MSRALLDLATSGQLYICQFPFEESETALDVHLRYGRSPIIM